jgi:hypothetical protein
MVKPYTSSSAKQIQQRGKLGAYKQDLLAHRDGMGFRQDATTVDMNPQLTFFPHKTVQGTLEAIETFLQNDNSYISIGDGTNSFGEFNVGSTGYPTIESCFTGALATARLANGGIILLKSGQYDFSSTVTLPAGVSVIGEFSTQLNATTANPIFKISESESDTVRVFPATTTDGHKISKLYNLTFYDALGDSNPYLNLSSVIKCERGSNLIVEQCSMFGKIGSIGSPPPVTRHFISYDTGTTSSLNTILRIESCQISAVQQVVDFDTEVSRTNKLYIRNNRFWVSGRLGVALINRYISAVTFRACDATLTNNQIWFGLNSSTLQTIRSAFSCYDAGSSVRNLIVFGNQGHYYDSTLTDDDNRLLTEDNDGLQYIRASVNGNVMGGASDSNTWYITVGDGANSVGDINGELAIQNIVEHFYEMNVGDEHGGMIIYVKPGSYTINDKTYFETPAGGGVTGLPLALIGVSENGNFPTINFDIATPTTDGQEMMFGHHIENIYFNGGSNYYKIMIRNDFSNPDSRTVYFTNVLIKNCSFKNCSIGMLSSSSSASTEYMKNEIFIEDCQFANTATISNMASPEEMFAIEPSRKNGNIYIKRCNTLYNNWRGGFFRLDATNADTLKLTQVEISDCIYTSLKNVALFTPFTVENVKNVTITNNFIDVSNSTAQPITCVYVSCNTDNTSKNNLIFKNNHMKGSSSAITPASGLYSFYFDQQEIEENTFENLTYSIYELFDYNGSTTTIETLNVNINKNRCIIGTNSNSFYLATRGGAGVSNVVNGRINISNNSIDMQARTAALGYSISGLSNTYGVIVFEGKTADELYVNVSDNNIHDLTALERSFPDVETAIALLNVKSSKIVRNVITFSNRSTSRSFYAIYVSPDGPTAAYSSNDQFTDISDNDISSTNSTVGFTREVVFIFIRNTDNLVITRNRLNKVSGSASWFIKALETSGTAGNEGVITDNILSEDLGNGGIRYKNDNSHQNIKLYVARNKNQKVIQEIDCTEFLKYGYNRNSNNPYSDATLLLKSKDKILSGSILTNVNRHQLHIMSDGRTGSNVGGTAVISTWTNMPEGLYYTNAYDDSNLINGTDASPQLYMGPYGASYLTSQTKHQILIPLRVPNFVKITDISIPIYWKNLMPSSYQCGAGASIICGNDVAHPSKIEYIADSGTWASSTVSVASGSDDVINLNNTTSFYLNPTRNTTGYSASDDDYLTTINCYILLSLYIYGYDVSIDRIYFAVPYAKVSYLY